MTRKPAPRHNPIAVPFTLLALALLTAGCATDNDTNGGGNTRTGLWWQCPPVKGKTGLEHGKKCTTHADCQYGYCMKGGFLTGYNDAISYCTKNNNCVGDGSDVTAPCSYDDTKTAAFSSAFEKSTSGGNTKRTSPEPYKVCAVNCASDADCQAWNPEMPDCIKSSTDYVSMGTKGICGVNPLK